MITGKDQMDDTVNWNEILAGKNGEDLVELPVSVINGASRRLGVSESLGNRDGFFLLWMI